MKTQFKQLEKELVASSNEMTKQHEEFESIKKSFTEENEKMGAMDAELKKLGAEIATLMAEVKSTTTDLM